MSTERKITINTLPAEILSDIFILCRNSVPPPSLRWMIITHICHVWRAVCLAHAALWDSVNIRSPAAANEVLARARYATSLSVHLTPRPTDSDPFLKLLPYFTALPRPQSVLVERLTDTRWRICEVHVVGRRKEVLETLRAVAHSSAHIHTLHIASDDQLSASILDTTSCASAFPQLHTLSLHGYGLAFSSPAYAPTLCSLTIDLRCPEAGWECDFSLDQILDLLGRLCCLERLMLCFCSPENVSDGDDNVVIALAGLEYLKIVDTDDYYCGCLLELLGIPTECDIDVEIRSGSEGDINNAISAVHFIFDTDTQELMSSLTASIDRGDLSVVCEGLSTRRVRFLVNNSHAGDEYLACICSHVLSSATLLLSFSLELGKRNSLDTWEEIAPRISAKDVRIAMKPRRSIDSILFPLLCRMDGCPCMCSLTVEGLDFRSPEGFGPGKSGMAKRVNQEKAVLYVVKARGMPRSAVRMRDFSHLDKQTRKRWEGCIWENNIN